MPLKNSATSKTIYFRLFRTGTDSQIWNEEGMVLWAASRFVRYVDVLEEFIVNLK